MATVTQDTSEIDAVRQSLQEARDRLQATDNQLKLAIDELGLALANQNQRTRGKKSAAEKIEKLVATLHGEREDLVRDIEDLENRLYVSRPGVAWSSVKLPQLPAPNPANCGEGATAKMSTGHGVGDQEGPSRPGNGREHGQHNTPEPVASGVDDTVAISEQRNVQAVTTPVTPSNPQLNPGDTGIVVPSVDNIGPVDPRVNDVAASSDEQLTSEPVQVDARDPETPESTESNPAIDPVNASSVTNTPTNATELIPESNPDPADISPSVDSRGVVAEPSAPIDPKVEGVVKTSILVDGEARVAERGVLVLPCVSDIVPDTISEVVPDTVSDILPNTQYDITEKNKLTKHLSRTKRGAESPDHKRNTKRAKHEELRAILVKKAAKKRQRGGRGLLTSSSKKERGMTKEEATHQFSSQPSRSRHVLKLEANAVLGSSELDDGRQSSPEWGGIKSGVREKSGEVMEIEMNNGTDGKGEDPLTDDSDIVFISEVRAGENHYGNDNKVSDEESKFESMRLHNQTDLDDLQRTLDLPSPLVVHQKPSSSSEHRGVRKTAPKQEKARGQSETRRRSTQQQDDTKVTVTGTGQNVVAKGKVVTQRRSPKNEGKEEGETRSGPRELEKQTDTLSMAQPQSPDSEEVDGKGTLSEPGEQKESAERPKEENVDKIEEAEGLQEIEEDADGARGPGSGDARKKRMLTHREQWDAMPLEKQRELIESAREAVDAFLRHPREEKSQIPVHLRNWIRQISELCPEASYTTRALALHCLTTRCGNTICLYHHYHDKMSTINDSNPPCTHKVTGVPWQRNAYGLSPENRQEITLEATKALHCGCHADEVLWDFYWWKTQKLYSPTLDIAEPWMNMRLDPRSRGFFVQFLESFAYVSIDDIYTGGADMMKTQRARLKLMGKKIRATRKSLKGRMMRLAVDDSD